MEQEKYRSPKECMETMYNKVVKNSFHDQSLENKTDNLVSSGKQKADVQKNVGASGQSLKPG